MQYYFELKKKVAKNMNPENNVIIKNICIMFKTQRIFFSSNEKSPPPPPFMTNYGTILNWK